MATDPHPEYAELVRLFDEIHVEYEALVRSNADPTEHDAHRARLRKLIDAIHLWRQTHRSSA